MSWLQRDSISWLWDGSRRWNPSDSQCSANLEFIILAEKPRWPQVHKFGTHFFFFLNCSPESHCHLYKKVALFVLLSLWEYLYYDMESHLLNTYMRCYRRVGVSVSILEAKKKIVILSHFCRAIYLWWTACLSSLEAVIVLFFFMWTVWETPGCSCLWLKCVINHYISDEIHFW